MNEPLNLTNKDCIANLAIEFKDVAKNILCLCGSWNTIAGITRRYYRATRTKFHIPVASGM